ncbi:hypothetical protein QE152_g26093 [Popillia japonica]|uniref:Uncharacterized protein n=1 Tax=Popillia japonica TaxID=7064 RepID=A0AAW1K0A3_POPJA
MKITRTFWKKFMEMTYRRTQSVQTENVRPNLRDRQNLSKPARFNDFVLEDEIENLSTAMIGEVQDIPISKALQIENLST